ncbi:MAG: nicotinate-nucleotide--dimethylbenzimidazole phosphoribosyltransferase [Nitrospirae bacterium]|nr:nicotinate-nucleotide--dimethylbenzimidazole phosphoribosyltransferase [Candidatus Manganitrophaceae bacterium]
MNRKIQKTLEQIRPLDPDGHLLAKKRLDRLTKPPGSLGRLEELAAWYLHVTGKSPVLPLKKVIFVFAADHGVTEEGVSAYPKAVTAQMVYNFLRGGAAINVLARHVGAEVRVVDMGVDHDFGALPGLLDRKVSRGSHNIAQGPAMSVEAAERSLLIGIELAEAAAKEGVGLLATGDMGIGNTTPSAAITAIFTRSDVAAVTGRGTGIDDAALEKKRAVIQQALDINRPDRANPMELLSKVGGYEIAGIAGLLLGAAAHRLPVVIDGFISTAGALVAAALKPEINPFLLAAHRSAEAGHRIALATLGLDPLLDLNMRLGEGSGAALGINLVEASLRILTEMATFDEAGISEKG